MCHWGFGPGKASAVASSQETCTDPHPVNPLEGRGRGGASRASARPSLVEETGLLMPYARAGRAFIAGIVVTTLACSSEPRAGDAGARDRVRSDDTGRLFESAAPSKRIVSLIPAATEILFAIGAGSQLVARSDYCDHPPAARRLPSAGNGIRPAIEPILSFRPDLVVIFAGPDNAASIERLRELGAPVFAVRHNSIADLYLNIRRLGALTARSAAAESLAAGIQAALDSIAARRPDGPPVRVYYDLWGEPPHTIGGGSYLSELIRIAGGVNVFGDLDAPSPRVSLEAILIARPDVILLPVARPGAHPAAILRERSGWSAIAPVREGRVAGVDAELLHRLGPRLPDAARAIADAIEQALAPSVPTGVAR